MKDRIILLAAGALLSVAMGALAVTSGGFPSNPTFATVVVNQGGSAVLTVVGTNGNPATAGIRVTSNAAAAQIASQTSGVQFNLASGATAPLGLNVVNGTGVVVGAATGGDKGAGTINAVNVFVNGVAVSAGKLSYGSFVTSASACTILAAEQQSNIASCIRTGVGGYTVNLTTAYTTTSPLCTISGFAFATNNPPLVQTQPITTSTVSVITSQVTAFGTVAQVDGDSFQISCFGT